MVRSAVKDFWWILFLLLIPTQLGRHFWPEWSLIQGIRSDFLSPTLYLIDIVWIGLVISNFKLRISNFKKYWWFGLIVIINIFVAGNKWVAVYTWVRILQWIITVKLISNFTVPTGRQELQVLNYLKWIIPIWIIGETTLGLVQVINGGSIQGIFYWLGERRFNLNTIGIAQMSWWGEGMVRAYGTFSHPNSLGGFILVAVIWWNRVWASQTPTAKKIFYWMVNWMAVLGIVISGSRTVWILTLGLIIWWWRKYWLIFLGMGMILLGVGSGIVGGWDKESASKRWELNMKAVEQIKRCPLLGMGAGNFISQEFEYRQPVHNIGLLILAELGTVPILIIVGKVKSLKLKITKEDWVLIGAIVITGMVDHYWITLPQNRWLIAIVWGLMIGRMQSIVRYNK